MDKTGWARWLCVLPVVAGAEPFRVALCAWIIGRFLSQALKS
jgi:hypothetical protein